MGLFDRFPFKKPSPGIPSGPGLTPPKTPAPPVTATVEPAPLFERGQWVVLKGVNPYKGTLKAGKPYLVVTGGKFAVSLRGPLENGMNFSTFSPHRFRLYRDGVLPVTDEGADEYEDIMAAQELFEAGEKTP